MTIWNSLFWKDTVERMVFTVAQLLIAVLSADGLDLLQIDLVATLTTLAIAAGLVLLKCIVANAAVSGTVSPASFAKDERGI